MYSLSHLTPKENSAERRHASFSENTALKQRIDLLMKLERPLAELGFTSEVEALRQFASEAQFNPQDSNNQRFSCLMQKISQAIEHIPEEHLHAKKEYLRALAEKANGCLSKKRKRVKEDQLPNSQLQPAAKKMEYEKGSVIRDKGKEKVLADVQIPRGTPPLDITGSSTAEHLPFEATIQKIWVGDHNDLNLIVDGKKIVSLNWVTKELQADVTVATPIVDMAANDNFAAFAIAGEIRVYGKPKESCSLFKGRPFIGTIDFTYDRALVSEITKICLHEDSLLIGTKEEFILVHLPSWQKFYNRIEGEQKPVFHSGNSCIAIDKNKKQSSAGRALPKRAISSLAMNSEFAVMGSASKYTEVFKKETGEEFRFQNQNQIVSAVALSKQGSFMYSGSASGRVNIWNPSTTKFVKELNLGEHIHQIETVSGGAFILSSSECRGCLYYYEEASQNVTRIEPLFDIASINVLEDETQVTLFLSINKAIMRITYDRSVL